MKLWDKSRRYKPLYGLAKDTLLATCAKVRKNLQDLFPEIMILLLVLRKKEFYADGKVR